MRECALNRVRFQFKEQVVPADGALDGDHRHFRQPMRGAPLGEGRHVRRILEVGDGAGDVAKAPAARLQNGFDRLHREFDLFVDVALPEGFAGGGNAGRAGNGQDAARGGWNFHGPAEGTAIRRRGTLQR